MMLHIQSLSYFQNFSKFFKKGRKNVTEILKNDHEGVRSLVRCKPDTLLPALSSTAGSEISGCF